MEKRNVDDRLSNLPNDILVNILDRLNVREAARTSVLSRRWIQLPATMSQLTITAQDFCRPRTSMSDDELRRINAAVAEATKSILARRDPGGCTIRLLSTTFFLRDDTPISVGRSVGNAMATHEIEKAEFTVLTENQSIDFPIEDKLNYGIQFVSFFNECPNAFAGLTRLHLENLRFSESDFVLNILGTCKQLKCLSFVSCDTEDWITLQVEHEQLSELSIFDCQFDEVELKWLPKLTRANFEYWINFAEPPLSFGHVPLLEVVSLSNIAVSSHKMVKLSTLLFETSVRDLRLGFRCEKIWVQPECWTRQLAYVFHQLRIVNLVEIPEGYDLTWTMFILEGAPFLEELYMTVMDHHCEMQMDKEKRREGLYSEKKGVEWKSTTSNFKHHSLTNLIMFCFQSDDHMVRHVRRVLEAAVNLKDVYLYDRVPCRKCVDVKSKRFPRTKKHRCLLKNRMTLCIMSLAVIHFLSPCRMRPDHSARTLQFSNSLCA
ncbi:FBD-associated F-box protein At5g38590 [Lolium perenne]|uniref:FBD-associated F-box protein At5g38590 n=1 Tax=Lolium perenne TaxID=4522 RepID=UPI0021F691FB|nr:FBD-associated F-box protein At5g38590-like [Lolium perenne]